MIFRFIKKPIFLDFFCVQKTNPLLYKNGKETRYKCLNSTFRMMCVYTRETILMEKTIKKKTVIFSIGITILFLMVSLTSVVGFHAVNTSLKISNSPLFHLRLEKITNQKNNPSLSPMYIGKDKPIEIPLPTREVLTEAMLNQLSTEEIKEKFVF